MPNPCDHICSTGTEEQCSRCLASQFGAAVAAAEKANFLANTEADALRQIFASLLQLRIPGGKHVAGTDAPEGGAATL